MSGKKKSETFAPIGKQEVWHLYGLQSLAPRKFLAVVDKILRGTNRLVGNTPQTDKEHNAA